ncbi:MAG: hypothetical protein ACT4PZ_14365, partial [Panacagrimonas sp.]
MSALLLLVSIWPIRVCAQRDPQAEMLRKPGGAIRIPIPLSPEMREGLLQTPTTPAAPPYFRDREGGWF